MGDGMNGGMMGRGGFTGQPSTLDLVKALQANNETATQPIHQQPVQWNPKPYAEMMAPQPQQGGGAMGMAMGGIGGAAQGAGMGMAAGPWGALAGGIVGGLMGLFK